MTRAATLHRRANAMAAQARAEAPPPPPPRPKRVPRAKGITVADFHGRWRTLAPRENSSTELHNLAMTRGFVEQYGDRELAQITPVTVQRWAAEHPRHGRYVRTFFNDAVRLGLRKENPLDGAKLVTPKPREYIPPTQLEVRRLAQIGGKLHGDAYRAIVLVAGTTGIRQAELVQIEAQHVTRFPHTVIRLPQENVKGKRYERLVSFAPGAEDAERAFLRAVPELGRVFPRSTADIRKKWLAVIAEYGRHFRFHDLRSSAATWLIESGCRPEDVALMLWGHRDSRLLWSLYARADKEAAASRIASASTR
jgi:integrase